MFILIRMGVNVEMALRIFLGIAAVMSLMIALVIFIPRAMRRAVLLGKPVASGFPILILTVLRAAVTAER
jgi:hypothetical protein